MLRPKCKQRTEQMVYEYVEKQRMSVYKERALYQTNEHSFPVFSNGILYVQFCKSSTVRTIVMLTNEIQLIKSLVLPSTVTFIKLRSVLCEIIIYYPDTITFFSPRCLCFCFIKHDKVPFATKSFKAV